MHADLWLEEQVLFVELRDGEGRLNFWICLMTDVGQVVRSER